MKQRPIVLALFNLANSDYDENVPVYSNKFNTGDRLIIRLNELGIYWENQREGDAHYIRMMYTGFRWTIAMWNNGKGDFNEKKSK